MVTASHQLVTQLLDMLSGDYPQGEPACLLDMPGKRWHEYMLLTQREATVNRWLRSNSSEDTNALCVVF